MTIAIIDYGMGNVLSLQRMFDRLGRKAIVTKQADEIAQAEKLVLPGVGHFTNCMEALIASSLRPVIESEVLSKRKPLLGICVGMQMLARSSEESGDQAGTHGLGWLDAEIKRFPSKVGGAPLRVPHVGWNIVKNAKSALFDGIKEPRFYFTHSYYAEADSDIVIGSCDYGLSFAAALGSGPIYAVQFHPEKSHEAGLRLLDNFASQS